MTKIPEPHTPLPWKSEIKQDGDWVQITGNGDDPHIVCACNIGKSKKVTLGTVKDFAFIPVACNTFPELVERLEAMINAWERLPEGNHSHYAIQTWIIKNLHPEIEQMRSLLNRIGSEADG